MLWSLVKKIKNKLEINYLKKKIYIFYDSLVLVEVLSIDQRH